jgi:hypothetical protein
MEVPYLASRLRWSALPFSALVEWSAMKYHCGGVPVFCEWSEWVKL